MMHEIKMSLMMQYHGLFIKAYGIETSVADPYTVDKDPDPATSLIETRICI